MEPGRTRKVYCGPAALAAVTGKTVGECERHVNRVRGWRNRPVHGMDDYEIEMALARMGIRTSSRKRERESLLRAGERLDPGLYVVTVTGHFVALERTAQGAVVSDTYGIQLLSQHPCRRKQVKRILQVVGTQTPAEEAAPGLAKLLRF
jgi:hypothetical protein